VCCLSFEYDHALFVAPGFRIKPQRLVLVLEKILSTIAKTSTSTNTTIKRVFLIRRMASVAKAQCRKNRIPSNLSSEGLPYGAHHFIGFVKFCFVTVTEIQKPRNVFLSGCIL
jgi:hypothetical protein